MKHLAVAIIWTYLLLWVANYLAVYASIPFIVTGSVAVLIGVGYTFERMRRSARPRKAWRDAEAGSSVGSVTRVE